jgi:hypothetical protein
MPAPSFQPQRRRGRAKLVAKLLAAVVLLALAAVVIRAVVKQRAHDDAVQMLRARVELEQKDSMHADAWQGGIGLDGANYMLMSFHAESRYVREFLSTLAIPVSALVMFIDNRGGRDKHIVDLRGARLHFAGNVTIDAIDHRAAIDSATTNRAAADEAFPAVIHVPPEKLIWGKLLFIPADTDLHKLLAVSVQIDGKATMLEGRFFTAEEKRQLSAGR